MAAVVKIMASTNTGDVQILKHNMRGMHVDFYGTLYGKVVCWAML